MKAILMSIQPKWCELIVSGKKTIEVRKTAPKEVPFKVYVYETKAGFIEAVRGTCPRCAFSHGKVIGEFICDRVEEFQCCCLPFVDGDRLGYRRFLDNGVYKLNEKDTDGIVFERQDRYIDSMLKNDDLREMQLSPQELFDYIGLGKKGYALHISDLKIYDEPKELGEFRQACKIFSKRVCGLKALCGKQKGICDGTKKLTRPPQSWQYVEELKND